MARGFALFWAILLVCTSALASTFEVAPTTVTLFAASPSGVIYVANHGTEPVFAQIEAFDWQQADAKNALTPSHTFMISPPMVRLLPGQRQTIRLMMRGDVTQTKERAFRLVISELPDPSTKKDGVQVLLQFLVPVFVEDTAKTPINIEWSAHAWEEGIVLTAHNGGNRHVKLSDVFIARSDDHKFAVSPDAFNYLLAGADYYWKIPLQAAIVGEKLNITAHEEKENSVTGACVIGK